MKSTRKYNIGDTINNIEILNITKGNHNSSNYICKCLLCNSVFEIRQVGHLVKTQDCGCVTKKRSEIVKKDIIGKRCGKLIALECLNKKTKSGGNIWLCQCDCGNKTEVSRSNFRKKIVESCGHCKIDCIGNIPQTLFTRIKNSKVSKILGFDLDIEYLWNLYLKQNRKCNLSKRLIQFSHNNNEQTCSLDRIDSKIGYLKGNVQWLHKDLNIIKNKYDQNYFISLCKSIAETNKDNIIKVDRPSWYDYFLGIACVVSQRSIDAQTKCGCVLVNEDNHIIATGYNSFLKGMPDEILPNTRPEKYPIIMHAEKCALFNAIGLTWNKNVTAFITMQPCLDCLSSMIASNIKKIVVIDRDVSSKTSENKDYWELFLHHSGIEYIKMKPKLDWIYNI